MASRRIEFLVYLVGTVVLGLFQARLRAAIDSDGIAFVAVLGYLVFLRALGWLLKKALSKHEQNS